MREFLITIPSGWVTGIGIDTALTQHSGLFDSKPKIARFQVQSGCALKIGACIRFLSIVNQLALCGVTVEIVFEDRGTGVMGYLSRMGFFECLSPAIKVSPNRPEISGRVVYGGGNNGLVEIAPLSPRSRDRSLPNRLAETAARLHFDPKTGERLGDEVFTIFSELIGNVYDHSGSRLDGYAALQSYTRRRRGPGEVEIAVSDSGIGILATLRPALTRTGHVYADLDDADLLFKAITEGVSKNGVGYGCGLRLSADKALLLKADLEIRLPECRMNLVPRPTTYRQEAMLYGADGLPHIEGTHLCFDFRLDT